MSTYNFNFLILDKDDKIILKKIKNLQQMVLGQIDVHKWKTEKRPVLFTLLKNKLQLFQRPKSTPWDT